MHLEKKHDLAIFATPWLFLFRLDWIEGKNWIVTEILHLAGFGKCQFSTRQHCVCISWRLVEWNGLVNLYLLLIGFTSLRLIKIRWRCRYTTCLDNILSLPTSGFPDDFNFYISLIFRNMQPNITFKAIKWQIIGLIFMTTEYIRVLFF